MGEPLDLDLLRTFVCVAETGGFRRAAEQRSLTQSTISQQVQRLERSVGRALFARSTRSVALTADGETLLGDARRLLHLEEAARRRLAGPRLSGTVRLGATEEVASGPLPPALGRFARLHPEVRLVVHVGVSRELIERVDSGALDVVLAKRLWGTTRGRLIWSEPLVWVAADDYELQPDAPLPLALFGEPSVSREAALAALRATDRSWQIVYTSPSLTGVQAAALAGLAITAIPRSAVRPGLRIVGEDHNLPPLPELEFCIFHKATPDPATAALTEVLSTLEPYSAPR